LADEAAALTGAAWCATLLPALLALRYDNERASALIFYPQSLFALRRVL